MNAALIGIDWGTSHARAYLLDGKGALLQKDDSLPGLTGATVEQFPKLVQQLRQRWSPELPVIMCGMVGSRNGWAETAYVPAPADRFELARALHPVADNVWIVPGVCANTVAGQRDVMRSEETQIIGAIASDQRDGWYCLPGTHSKWVQVWNEQIISLSTFMTGELFALLKAHSLLGKVMEGDTDDHAAFMLGVQRSLDEAALTHLLFGARAKTLLGDLQATATASYISGLLIGHELKAMESLITGATVTLIGRPQLCRAYENALQHVGAQSLLIDGEVAAIQGLFAMACAHQLVVPSAA